MFYHVVHISEQGYMPALQKLEREVSRLISEGWEPTGGIVFADGLGGRFNVMQSMYRKPGPGQD